ncbi:MAG: S8 family serine peptidase, partial [Phycisphaeraceae bacterium]
MTSRIIGRGLWALAAALFFSLTAAAANGSLLPVDAIGLSQVQSLFPNLDGRDDITGQSQRVAVIDTGIQLNHPALGSSTVVAGINYAAGATYGSTTPSQYADQNGHATFVAGVIGSRDPSRLGVAPGVEFVSVRALASDGTGAFSDIAKSLEWVVTNATSLNITAVNLSMGSSTLYTSPAGVPTYSTYNRIAAAFNTLKNMNIVVAVASGNSGSSTSMSLPAIMDNIISVGATDTTDQIASYSNRNQYLELLAPGSSLN